MTLLLNGSGVSRGIAIGQVRVLHEIQPQVRRKKIIASKRDAEVRRFRKALKLAEAELERAKSQLPRSGSGTISAILDSHVGMLHDAALVEPIENLISEHLFSSEWALAQQRDQLLAMFESIDDTYIKQRATDIEETIARLLKHLGSRRRRTTSTGKAVDKFILVSKNLAPSDLIYQEQRGLIGAITTEGSPLSHTTIIAKDLEIPLIIRVQYGMQLLEEADRLIIDGGTGMVLANADPLAQKSFKGMQRTARQRRREIVRRKVRTNKSLDQSKIEIFANIASVEEYNQARKLGAEGVGLYRTESLFLNREELPTEEEHLRTYRRLVTKVKGAPLVLRTMDVWSSRRLPGIEQVVPRSAQPALGLRAIRLCLRHPEFFRPQLNAILRAAHYGPVAMLLPMVSGVQEVREMLQMIDMAKADLKRQRRVFDQNIRVGVMIEVPSAAVSASLIAPLVDFMAIGSNDLTQYTLAMDRDDANIQPLLDPLNPAILQLIHETVKAANHSGIPVSLCGEMAGEPAYTRLLLGLGLRQLSMHPTSIPDVKHAVTQTDIAAVTRLSRAMRRAANPRKTQQLLDKINSL
ncbi:MAG: phosphoenolpyruvate--protein phosphotransferase [Gammaproteobacteria bacterium]|nr:phosphoenolpyruvate--protein phosphotransferase [Gammaproteobacteria bacterium]